MSAVADYLFSLGLVAAGVGAALGGHLEAGLTLAACGFALFALARPR